MPQVITHFLQRQAMVEKVLRCAMAQRMRAATLPDNLEAVDAAADHVADRARRDRSDRGIQCQKQPSFWMLGTGFADVAQDRPSYAT